MRVDFKSLGDDWEYPDDRSQDKARPPNKKFKMNQPDTPAVEVKNAGRSKKKSRRKNNEYTQQRSKARNTRH